MTDNTNLGFLTQDELLLRKSPTLAQNPNAKLDQKLEVENYLSKFEQKYFKEIETLSQADDKPLSKNVRVIVTIIAYNEGSKIKKALSNYTNQDIDHSLFEIVILDNHPQSTERDNTFEEVQSFISENPTISVVYAHKVWTYNEYATVGNARKYVHDIGIMRISKCLESKSEAILISNDADSVGFDPNYLSSILSEFDNNQTTDALVTLNVVPLNTIIKPNAYAVLTLWDAIDKFIARSGEPYNLIGRSSATRSSMYSAIGGYNPRDKIAEDIELGWLVSDAREWNPNSVIQLKKTRHVLNPRRILMAIANRTPVNEMYYDFVSKPEIRNVDNDKLLSFIPDELDWELLEEDADSFWQGRTTGMYKWRGDRFASDFKQAMDKIGAEFQILNDRIKLTSLEKLLSNYKEDFGKNINIVHSEERKWDPVRQAEMKNFFSSVSDTMIASRLKLAEKISLQIAEQKDAGNKSEMDRLLVEYRRLAGHEYIMD